MDWNQLKGRIIRAAKLDIHLYEEVEADKGAMRQAMLVVVFSSIAAGIGSIGGILISSQGTFRQWVISVVIITIGALISWYIWAWLTYLIGTRILPEPQTHSDLGELLRTIGFSSSPGLIRVVGIIPGLSILVNFVAAVYMLVAMIIAVRQALDYKSSWRAVGVCLIGWVIQGAILVLLFFFRIPNKEY